MSTHHVRVLWENNERDVGSAYSRSHVWEFDEGVRVPASSSPSVVPLPYSNPAAVDPEEAFVAALSSCHMLWFLHLAQEAGYDVKRYDDRAVGKLGRDIDKRLSMTEVELHPRVEFAGEAPSPEALHELHERAHHTCFLASSVKTQIRVVSG